MPKNFLSGELLFSVFTLFTYLLHRMYYTNVKEKQGSGEAAPLSFRML